MDAYPRISDHGLIGDLQTAALVATDGTIDWFCSPRFDSPSIFGALLDRARGGYFRVHPTAGVFECKQLYFPDTAILVTRFLTERGAGEVLDFMPVIAGSPSTRHRLVRVLRCVRGSIDFDIEISPRFDYGREPHRVELSDDGATFTGEHTSLTLSLIRDPDTERLGQATVTADGDLRFSLSLTAGQMRGVVLETDGDSTPIAVPVAEAQRMFDATAQYWRTWLAQSTYVGRWREEVERSAITLKLLTHMPTGGVVAAPTAGLPEQIGGERNWDYRYTWVRDASFSVTTLLRMGFHDEATAFGFWLLQRGVEQAGRLGSGDNDAPTGPLNIMYRVDGDSRMPEQTLEGWEGYRGSYPVRIGNDAAGQLQLDIYGEAMDAVWNAYRGGVDIGHRGWVAIVRLLDWLADNWDQPEEGIWETRGGRKAFTYGRLMCWVAFDRAIRLATAYGRPAPLEKWRAQRDAIYTQIMERGWSPTRGAFVQQYGEDVLDASLLKMTQVGFIAARDPMWLSTLAAIEKELVSDSLVFRYDPSASPDGLRGSEGTFSLCTFLYVDALARADRLDDARLVFEKMLAYSNHLGLYSEEIGPTGEQIGNFPQAFTHLALIDAAMTLNERLEKRADRATKRATKRRS